jgi:hypothetical protein
MKFVISLTGIMEGCRHTTEYFQMTSGDKNWIPEQWSHGQISLRLLDSA